VRIRSQPSLPGTDFYFTCLPHLRLTANHLACEKALPADRNEFYESYSCSIEAYYYSAGRMLFLTSSVLLSLIPFVVSQTSTDCDPTKKSCPDDPAFGASTAFNFQQTGVDSDWVVLGSGEKISQDSNGLHFTIDGDGQSPTLCSKGTISSCIWVLSADQCVQTIYFSARLQLPSRLRQVTGSSLRLSCSPMTLTKLIGNGWEVRRPLSNPITFPRVTQHHSTEVARTTSGTLNPRFTVPSHLPACISNPVCSLFD